MIRAAVILTAFVALISPASTHHGRGTFDGSNEIGVANLPYKADPCKERGFLDYSKETKK